MDSETTFQVGDRVRVLRVQAGSEGIPEMEGMVGGTYAVEDLTAESAVLDGWYFNFSALQLIERDGKAIATDHATECRDNPDDSSRRGNRDTLSRRDEFAKAAMQGLFYHPDLYDNSPDTHAENAVAYADALIAALDAGEAGND